MAVVKNLVETTLQMVVQKGVNTKGDPVLAKVNYRNIKGDAIEQDIFDVALALSDLQEYPLNGVQLVDMSHLIDMG